MNDDELRTWQAKARSWQLDLAAPWPNGPADIKVTCACGTGSRVAILTDTNVLHFIEGRKPRVRRSGADPTDFRHRWAVQVDEVASFFPQLAPCCLKCRTWYHLATVVDAAIWARRHGRSHNSLHRSDMLQSASTSFLSHPTPKGPGGPN